MTRLWLRGKIREDCRVEGLALRKLETREPGRTDKLEEDLADSFCWENPEGGR